MDSNEVPELSEAWWNKKKPKSGTDKTAAKFGKALGAAEKELKGLSADSDEAKLAGASKSLAMLRNLADMVMVEARKSASDLDAERKKAKEKNDTAEKVDLDNTVRVLGAPFDALLSGVQKRLDDLGGEAEPNLGSTDAYTDYLSRILPKVKAKPMNFAFAMVSGEATGHRLMFHRTKAPEAMAKALRKDTGARKLIWGVAWGAASADKDDDIGSKTLALDLAGPLVPGSARRARVMFAKLGIATIKRVKIIVDGVDVETDTEGEGDDIAPISEDDGDVPVAGLDDQPALLETGWLQMKAKIMPLLDQAILSRADLDALPRLKAMILEKEQDGAFDKAIALVRDRAVPVLKALQRTPAPDSAIKVNPSPVAPVANAPNPLNASLGKVLARMYPPPDQWAISAWFSGAAAEPKAPADFFGAVQVSFSGAPEDAKLQREWAINLALLQHVGAGLPADSPEKSALDTRAMGYLLKFANIPNSAALGWQGNPLDLKKKDGFYHRSGGTPLYDNVKRLTATSLGVDPSNLCLCSDARIMEEVRRHFTASGELVDFENFDALEYQKVITSALGGQPVFVDITRLMKSKEATSGVMGGAQELVSGFRAEVWKQLLAARGIAATTEAELDGLGLDPATVAEVKREANFTLKKLQSNMKFGGMMGVGDQLSLGVFQFPATGAVDKDALKNPNGDAAFRALQGHSGFTAGPLQLLEQLTALTPNVATALRELGVTDLPKVGFPKDQKLPKYAGVGQDLLRRPVGAAFANLGTADVPFQQVTTKTLMKLLQGLDAEGVGAKLAAAGLEPMWQLSLGRIESFMASALKNKDSMKAFLNDVQLIMEEVSTLLVVARPYTEADFDAEMKARTKMFPDDFDGVKIDFSLKNSASRCFNAVLTACEDVKEGREGLAGKLAKRGLDVLVQGDSYYEPSTYVLETAREHSAHGFNTDAVDDASAFDAQFETLREKGAKLEVYLCEFHHNISYDRKEYKPEDVAKQVRKLIDSDLVANPFTVALDTTIAKTDDPAIKDFLAQFKTEIAEGRMNVVIYRSAQKFDQMGADTFNGGVMCAITADGTSGGSGHTTDFQNALGRAGEPGLDHNVQGLTHLNKHAQEEVNAYRGAIMANTAKMTARNSTSPAKLPDAMLLNDANVGGKPLRFAQNTDESAPFIDLKFPDLPAIPPEPKEGSGRAFDSFTVAKEITKNMYTDLFKLFGSMIEDPNAGLAGSSRASFGFQHSNVTLIDDVKMRFNPGLEDEGRLKQFSDLIIDASDVMGQALTDMKADGQIPEMNAYKAITGGVLSMDTIKAHRGLTAALAGPDESAKNAARLKMADAWSKARRGVMACNPCGALRELDAITEPFKSQQAAAIASLRSRCEMMRGLIRTEEVTFAKAIAKAKIELEAGLPGLARATLNNVGVGALSNLQTIERDVLLEICDRQDAQWDDASNALVEEAEEARSEGDYMAVMRTLKAINHAQFQALRADRIKELKDWALAQSQDAADKRLKSIAELKPDANPYDVLEQIGLLKRQAAAVAAGAGLAPVADDQGKLPDDLAAALGNQEAKPRRPTADPKEADVLKAVLSDAQFKTLSDLETAAAEAARKREVREKIEMAIRRVDGAIKEGKADDARKMLEQLEVSVRQLAPDVLPRLADLRQKLPGQ